MSTPLVSFIVPCYNLAHLLPDCIRSILAQSFTEYELLIMDDASPDDTRGVALTFSDPRIRYIRNERNLGHLRNYNKGIELSRGKYIWLISADDKLRRPYVLEHYVRFMEAHPTVGYIFCPAVGLRNGSETGIVYTGVTDTYYYGRDDRLFKGPEFVSLLLQTSGGILSPTVMVRRECYERISMFPLDMPHQGDTFLWLAWALDYDVAYLAYPMVNYRSHDLNMSKTLFETVPKTIFTDEVNVLWKIIQRAEAKGYSQLVTLLESTLASKYMQFALFEGASHKYAPWGMAVSDCYSALAANSRTPEQCNRMRRLLDGYLAGNTPNTDIAVTVETGVALRVLWCSRNMCMAGQYSEAQHLLATMMSRRSGWKRVDPAILGNLLTVHARTLWHAGKPIGSIVLLVRAVRTRPRLLGRPVRRCLRFLSQRAAFAGRRRDVALLAKV